MASVISAYFSIMASSALIHIQKTEPYPPIAIDEATPAIFPTPSVPASASVTARNGDIPPELLRDAYAEDRLCADEVIKRFTEEI